MWSEIFVSASLNESTINQVLQCMRKKLLINWQIHNRLWLWWQAYSNLDLNDGLRISRTNYWMDDHVDERTNEQMNEEWVPSVSSKTTYIHVWTRVTCSSWYTPYTLAKLQEMASTHNFPHNGNVCLIIFFWNRLRNNKSQGCHIHYGYSYGSGKMTWLIQK